MQKLNNLCVKINRGLLYLVLVLVLFCSCVSIRYVEPEFKSYLSEFIKITDDYCGSHGYFNPSNYVIHKSILPEHIIGLCTRKYNSFEIQFDERYWLRSPSEEDRYALTFHEFTHCFLGLNHNDYYPNYMNSYNDATFTKAQVKQQLIKNLESVCQRI